MGSNAARRARHKANKRLGTPKAERHVGSSSVHVKPTERKQIYKRFIASRDAIGKLFVRPEVAKAEETKNLLDRLNLRWKGKPPPHSPGHEHD